MAKAQVVGKKVFDVIEREPMIKDHKNVISEFILKQRIEFRNVTFRYPTAPEGVRSVL
jgi:hypothetical protein